LSRSWFGPATKPSTEMDRSQAVSVMETLTTGPGKLSDDGPAP
jgi:hypothetical protein